MVDIVEQWCDDVRQHLTAVFGRKLAVCQSFNILYKTFSFLSFLQIFYLSCFNDLTIGWQSLNLLSHPNATQGPQVWQAWAGGEILNYLLSHKFDILK